MTHVQPETPILIELDEQTRAEQVDKLVAWLDNVLMLQASFRAYVEDTADKIREPHIKEYLAELGQRARVHEQQAEELYRVVGREPSRLRKGAGALLSTVSEVLADVQGLAGGAKGNWRDMRQLFLMNADSMGAFAIAEQLGLELGIPAVVDIAFPIENEKARHHLLLQEYVLEMASRSILYETNV
jgi:hypothetical protein